MNRKLKRRTDLGTIIIHFGLIGLTLLLGATGATIAVAADHLVLPEWMADWLPRALPWFLHLMGGYALLATLVGYLLYVRGAGLAGRLRLDGAWLASLKADAARKSQAVATLSAVLILAALFVLVATGLIFHWLGGAGVVRLHLWLSVALCVLVTVHVAAHLASGGVEQALRVLRPAPEPLPVVPGRPGRIQALRLRGLVPSIRLVLLAGGIMLGGGSALAYFGLQRVARPELRVVRVTSTTPDIADPALAAPAWRKAVPVTLETAMGSNLGGTGASTVTVRALHDGLSLWMAFTWDDPTRSVRAGSLLRTRDGWRMLSEAEPPVDDRFAAMFARTAGDFGPGAFHPGPRPLSDHPRSASGKGLHYTTDGSMVDVWHWRAAASDTQAACGHDRFGPPQAPTPAQMAGHSPYRGGMVSDPVEGFIVPNRAADSPLRPLRLPLGPLSSPPEGDPDPALGDPDDVTGVLGPERSVPWSPQAEAGIPPGSIIPAYAVMAEATPRVRCRSRWSAGRWTLVVTRPLSGDEASGRPALVSGLAVWLAVFDRTIAGHTRHLRPLTLEIDP